MGYVEVVVAQPERPEDRARLSLRSAAAEGGPAGQQALLVGKRALDGAHVGGNGRVREPALDGCQLRLGLAQLGPGIQDRGHGRPVVAGHDLRQMRGHEVAAHRHLTAVGVVRARENAQQRGLAAAVGTEQADARSVGYGQVEAVQDPAAAERLLEASCGEERGWAGHYQ